MAKLTKAELNQLQKQDTPSSEASDADKKSIVTRVYEWQQSEKIHAWDEESLQDDLGMSIQNFTLAGETDKGAPVEVEFRRPLDEDVEFQGVAHGYRLIMVKKGFYHLQRYRKPHHNEEDAEEA